MQMGRLESVSEITWTIVTFSPILFSGFLLTCLLAVPSDQAKTRSRIIDLDVDIGADAVDYKYALA
jgi:hypothetical protein